MVFKLIWDQLQCYCDYDQKRKDLIFSIWNKELIDILILNLLWYYILLCSVLENSLLLISIFIY
jgi:hypothetical protein